MGREAELKDLELYFQDTNQIVLVSGIGGVGKTEICKAYFNKHKNDFKHVGWVSYISSIKESFVNQIRSNITLTENDTLDDHYMKIIEFICNLDENTLLVIDNVDNKNDEGLNDVRKLPCKVLITSRIKFEGSKQYILGVLNNSACKELFYRYYTVHKDDIILDKIIELACNHTLTIELLAKTAENATMKISELYENLKQRGFNINDIVKETVTTFWNGQQQELLFNHLLKVFELSGITETERYVLTNLSILPLDNITINELRELLELDSNNDINSLIKKGWINKKINSIEIHPLIQETIRYQEKPNTEKCINLIKGITKKLNVQDDENPLTKVSYTIIGDYIYKYIQEKNDYIANLLNNLAGVCGDLGQINKSLEYQLNAVSIKESILDKNNPELATFYNNLSNIYKHSGKLDESLRFGLKAIEIIENQPFGNLQELTNYYNTTAMVYLELGKLDESLSLELRAINIEKEFFYENDNKLAIMYSNLSLIYVALGKLEESLEFQLKAVDIREKNLDEEHPGLIDSYDSLAMIYRNLGYTKKSLHFETKAVTLSEKLLDKSHPNLAICYNNLGQIYNDLGEFDKSLKFHLKDIEIKEKVLDRDHPALATSYNNISLTYNKMGKNNLALEFQLKAIDIRERILDEEHINLADSYANIALIYYNMGQVRKSLEFQLKDVNILKKAVDENHPNLAKSYNSLASIYYSLGLMNKSLDVQNKAIDIQEKVLHPNHPDLATSYNISSMIYEAIGDINKSVEYKQKSMQIIRSNF
ncbi:tetratricopeptide repeat protein [Clostridium sp.]|uniref:tetratricopeptide repeat protein n=1 Tax=Clostridium sp. TaxID=1506 RepID=UPI003217F961